MTRLVPARVSHLTDRLAEAFFAEPQRKKAFYDLARLVEDLERHYASVNGRAAQALYEPYDPDGETVPAPSVPRDDPSHLERLFARLTETLDRANFERVEPDSFSAPREVAGLKGAKLDLGLDEIERFLVLVRGVGQKALALRRAKNWYRRVEVELPTHARVAVAIRTRSDPHVQLKLYKDIAQTDLHLVLPTVRLKMRTLDKLTLSSSGGAAIYSAVKTLLLVGAWLAHGQPLPVQVVVVFVAIVLLGSVYGGKTLLDYTKIKASYLTLLAEHLHALTLASNRSFLAQLAELAAEEETKEVLLGYAFAVHAGEGGITADALRDKARAWVREQYACDVDFDVPDALRKLDERALVRALPSGARVAVPLDEAVHRLDQAWDDLFTPKAPPPTHIGI